MKFISISALLILCFHSDTIGQVLDDGSAMVIKLGDETSVIVYRALPEELASLDANGNTKTVEPSNDFYYLPTNLRLSKRPDGVPEFLFTKFTTEKKDGVSGAIMHFLMQFGLTEAQRIELETKLKAQLKNTKAVVKGQVQLKTDEQAGSFQIISATLSDKSLATSILNGRAPVLDGGKTAVATRLTADGAQLMASSFEKSTSIADLSISLNYKFSTNIPAFKGKLTFYWDRVANYVDSMVQHEKEVGTHEGNGFWGWFTGARSDNTSNISKEKFEEITQSMIEKQCIVVDIRESGLPDDRLTAIRQAFLDLVVKTFTTATNVPEAPQMGKPKNSDGSVVKDIVNGLKEVGIEMTNHQTTDKELSVKETFRQKVNQRKTEELIINYSLPISKEFSLVGNLGSWYTAVKDNKSCVNSVNLNDPFFQHRDIRFIMDLEGKEMFEKEINYVTINARKKRTEGNSFEDRATMDLKYFSEKGTQTSMTYARGDDKDGDSFEYMTQWSLRGGNIYPAAPIWQKGQWEGVTLTPPVKPVTIEFEADPEELKTANFSRVTLQVRYSKFGKEVEENIPISVAKNESIVSKQIFMDRDTKGYAYRLIFNHKESGKLATEFSSKINDNYVYAAISEDMKNKNSNVFIKAIEQAKKITQPSPDGTVSTDKVLDMFKNIFGAITQVK